MYVNSAWRAPAASRTRCDTHGPKVCVTSCTRWLPVADAPAPTMRVMRGAPVAKEVEALGRKMYAPLACNRVWCRLQPCVYYLR